MINKDIKIEVFKSSGPGGQHKNKRFTAVKATHIPTGISSVASEQRSQTQNKNVALERLNDKVKKLTRKKKYRIATKIPRKVKENILEYKKKHSYKKSLRGKISRYEWE